MKLPAVEFHNVSLPELWPNGPGWVLPRYPKEVREVINMAGRQTSQESAGCEIRFVTGSPTIRVYLSAANAEVETVVFCGDFQHSTHKLEPGRIQCVHLQVPERFSAVQADYLNKGLFAPQVWRLMFSRNTVLFHGIDPLGHDLRAPLATEKPKLKWLAYGSSITHSHWKGYPNQAAMRLGVDVQNKGLSGSCHIEKEVADFLARKCDWDFITMELGINMRHDYEPAEFERRARYLVEGSLKAKPGKPVVLITVYPNFSFHAKNPGREWEWEKAYNEILRMLAKEKASEGVCLIEGFEVLGDFRHLSADLLHPSEYGHVRMGENLATALKPLIAEL